MTCSAGTAGSTGQGPFIAHSRNHAGRTDPLRAHLSAVAERAAEFAREFGAEEEAALAGLLHDLGKYGDLFQKRLRGEVQGIDHWSPGAWAALEKYKELGIASALAIQGHHVGLQRADRDNLASMNPDKWDPALHAQRQLSETRTDLLIERFRAEGLTLPPLRTSLYDHSEKAVSAMLDVRMLFSALVDADFLVTEAHFNEGEDTRRRPGPPLDPARALELLLTHTTQLAAGSDAAAAVSKLRSDLLSACLAAGEKPVGQFTLTAPTGSGKTLAMLAFALKHAAVHNLRRIVMVIPYLSIIDQTAAVFRSILERDLGPGYVLEHHSLAGTRGHDQGEGTGEDRERELSEDWDAPIVLTTSVQMLESLFANRPSACRKLHRLARSVILFDEVQTLPTNLAIPTLAALSRLSGRYGASVVFATATQPAFSHLDAHVRKWCSQGWQPTEIVPTNLRLFARLRRTKVEWPDPDTPVSWDKLADSLADDECRQALCVVNLKRHALLLFEKLCHCLGDDADLFHLSTNMCPAHRWAVLNEVRRRLEAGSSCRLISTQCVEAGVDVDFPIAFRAWGPLDAIVQVAGRCNRNGRHPIGRMRVFVPEDDRYPEGGYRQAASVARLVAASRTLDIDDPDLYAEYYRELYAFARLQDRNEELLDAITRRDFAQVAEHYHVIPDGTVNVLVPYDLRTYDELASAARREGISRRWIRQARPHTVGLYRAKSKEATWDWLEPVRSGRDREVDDWYVYLRPEHYNGKTGLCPPQSMDFLNG
ncbi:MAG: CRISPR-associated helicase Cas3 [Candidatus Bipolaricaulis sibiricus]|uniref:CRISPR-associated helicase Cas3 n=1 Tax=Bipolaricaulis sibiricus TaxID=2501609 RepID=A0A410FU92_BIPS1|nr:MAG: CRISPR-associated helicase Cas3 [Candidatus Bipolaricaulis sibiricus]